MNSIEKIKKALEELAEETQDEEFLDLAKSCEEILNLPPLPIYKVKIINN